MRDSTRLHITFRDNGTAFVDVSECGIGMCTEVINVEWHLEVGCGRWPSEPGCAVLELIVRGDIPIKGIRRKDEGADRFDPRP